jgi:hypothetical protein
MKTITTAAVVEDLYGVLEDLKKHDFDVLNIAMDLRGTYIYLNDGETKDPIPVVMEWVGKPAPKLTQKEWKARVKAAQAKGEAPATFLGKVKSFFFGKKKAEEEPVELPATAPVEPPPPPPDPVDPKFFRKII